MRGYWTSILLGLILVVSIATQVSPASAGTPPTIIPSHWNDDAGCTDFVYNPTSMEDYTWKTIAGEMWDSMDMDALKAFAVVIRSDAYDHRDTIETVLCADVGGYPANPNINTSEQSYLNHASSTEWPNSYDAASYTRGEALDPDQWYYYSTCQQTVAADLADQGWWYRTIITNTSEGIFSTSTVNWCKTQPTGTPWITPYSGMTFLMRW